MVRVLRLERNNHSVLTHDILLHLSRPAECVVPSYWYRVVHYVASGGIMFYSFCAIWLLVVIMYCILWNVLCSILWYCVVICDIVCCRVVSGIVWYRMLLGGIVW